eukprot:g1941.t1
MEERYLSDREKRNRRIQENLSLFSPTLEAEAEAEHAVMEERYLSDREKRNRRIQENLSLFSPTLEAEAEAEHAVMEERYLSDREKRNRRIQENLSLFSPTLEAEAEAEHAVMEERYLSDREKRNRRIRENISQLSSPLARSAQKNIVGDNDATRVIARIPPGPIGAVFIAADGMGDGAKIREVQSSQSGEPSSLQQVPGIHAGMFLESINGRDVKMEPFTNI